MSGARCRGRRHGQRVTALPTTEYPRFLDGRHRRLRDRRDGLGLRAFGRVPVGSLDLLVIDEAGQFSLANTIAVSAAARNLLLLGDPQQLPQVSQGTHPEPVDESALGWLAAEPRFAAPRPWTTSSNGRGACIPRCASGSPSCRTRAGSTRRRR